MTSGTPSEKPHDFLDFEISVRDSFAGDIYTTRNGGGYAWTEPEHSRIPPPRTFFQKWEWGDEQITVATALNFMKQYSPEVKWVRIRLYCQKDDPGLVYEFKDDDQTVKKIDAVDGSEISPGPQSTDHIASPWKYQ